MEEELLASRLLADDLKGSHRQRKYVDVRHEDPFIVPPVDGEADGADAQRTAPAEATEAGQQQQGAEPAPPWKRGCFRSTSHQKNHLKESRTPSKYQKEQTYNQHRRHCPQKPWYPMRFPYPRVA
jgi:hypothetical protein